MTKSVALMVAFSALVVSGISNGHAQAPLAGTPNIVQSVVTVGVTPPAVPPSGTIAPSLLYGAGPPIDGLDSNPYRDAPQLRKKSVADSGKARQSARGTTKASAPGTAN
jgi:hypothetical protein